MMEILSYHHNKIIQFKFRKFTALYNCNNGKTIFIPNSDLDLLDDYFEINDFFSKPNKAIENKVITICLNITSKCNLRCKYCFNDKSKFLDLSINETFKFIDSVILSHQDANKFFVDMAGSGEPLLHLDKILKIADYCEKKSNEIGKDVIPQLATNGVLLTREIASCLQKHKILFGISIDGYKELHNEIRKDVNGNGTYDTIINNYKSIEFKDYIGVAMTFDSDNVDIYRAYLNLASMFSTVSIRPARSNYSKINIEKIYADYELVANYIITEAVENQNFDFIIKIINGDDYFGKMLLKIVSNSYLDCRCDAGTGRLAYTELKEIKDMNNNKYQLLKRKYL